MRYLKLSESAEYLIEDQIQYARTYPLQKEEADTIHALWGPLVGADLPPNIIMLPEFCRVTFTIDYVGKKAYRHLSCVHAQHTPTPYVMRELLELYGFENPMHHPNTVVTVFADRHVNVIEQTKKTRPLKT